MIQKVWVLKGSTSGRTETKEEVWKGKQFPLVPFECFFLVDPTCKKCLKGNTHLIIASEIIK